MNDNTSRPLTCVGGPQDGYTRRPSDPLPTGYLTSALDFADGTSVAILFYDPEFYNPSDAWRQLATRYGKS